MTANIYAGFFSFNQQTIKLLTNGNVINYNAVFELGTNRKSRLLTLTVINNKNKQSLLKISRHHASDFNVAVALIDSNLSAYVHSTKLSIIIINI